MGQALRATPPLRAIPLLGAVEEVEMIGHTSSSSSPLPPTCESNTLVRANIGAKFDGSNTYRCSDKGFHKGPKGHGSKSCGNNKTKVALLGGGGGGCKNPPCPSGSSSLCHSPGFWDAGLQPRSAGQADSQQPLPSSRSLRCSASPVPRSLVLWNCAYLHVLSRLPLRLLAAGGHVPCA